MLLESHLSSGVGRLSLERIKKRGTDLLVILTSASRLDHSPCET